MVLVSGCDRVQMDSWYLGPVEVLNWQFRTFTEKLLLSITGVCNELLFGLRTRVKLDGILDEMSNSTAGYSFVHETANDLKAAYLTLVDHTCLSPLHGLMLFERWNLAAVDRYLRKVFDFLGLLSVSMHVLSGQSARGPKMLSIECENGPASLRGIFVYAGRIVYVTRHYKTRRATNNEF